jgi:AP-3 complex subunit mu
MAKIDGIIILDQNGYDGLLGLSKITSSLQWNDFSKPLISSHFVSHPPSYPSIHIDTFNHLLRRSRIDNTQLEPVLWVSGISGAGLCHLEKEGLRFLCPVSQEGRLWIPEYHLWSRGEADVVVVTVNPLFAFAFLETFIATLVDYLGDITETSLKDNFDIVYMVSQSWCSDIHHEKCADGLI